MPSSFRAHVLALSVVLAMGALGGCGGGSSNQPTNTGTGGGGNPNGNPSTGGAVQPPNVITIAAGQNASGIDISVPLPASSPTPNAQALGVTFTSQGSADNTGAQIKPGQAGTVLIFGPGLSANMQIMISGPQDITIANPQTIKSTDNTPGVAFDVVVSPTAALGARTVILQDKKNDITTFTGGLEVTQ